MCSNQNENQIKPQQEQRTRAKKHSTHIKVERENRTKAKSISKKKTSQQQRRGAARVDAVCATVRHFSNYSECPHAIEL